jgi:proteasome alpha subunit
LTGYQYDRQDVTARGLANWYAQTLGSIFTDSMKPFEVEIVVAEVAEAPAEDQIYRITFDGSVNDEHGYVAMGGQAEAIAVVLKEQYADNMTLAGALATAIAGLGAQANGDQMNITASQLEVAVLDRTRDHRTFRRLTGARLEALLTEADQAKTARQSSGQQGGEQASGGQAGDQPSEGSGEQGSTPPAPPDSANGQGPSGDSGS